MMKPGKELDLKIGLKVFGWVEKQEPNNSFVTPAGPLICNYWEDPVTKARFFDYDGFGGPHSTWYGYHSNIPKFSTSIEAAWRIVEKIGRVSIYSPGTPVVAEYQHGSMWSCELMDPGEIFRYNSTTADGETAAHAICLAALKIMGVT